MAATWQYSGGVDEAVAAHVAALEPGSEGLGKASLMAQQVKGLPLPAASTSHEKLEPLPPAPHTRCKQQGHCRASLPLTSSKLFSPDGKKQLADMKIPH